MDLKTVLNETDTGKETETEKEKAKEELIRKHKKPVQLRDIENRSASNRKAVPGTFETDEEITNLLEREKEDIYKQPWNKLENGLKINRLKLFIKKEVDDKSLSPDEKTILTKLLLTACRQNKLNRNADIIYDKIECIITDIKILKYEDNKYILDITELKKAKQTSKSKSNVERLIKSKS